MAISILDLFSNLDKITRPDYILFFLMVFIVTFLAAIIFPSRKPQLRRLPQLTAADEYISMAAERGQPVVYYFGLGNQMATGGVNDVNAWCQVIKYSAQKTGELENMSHGIGRSPQAYMLLADYVRQGYMESPHPELFVPSNFYQVPGGITESGADSVELMDIVNRRGCGALFLYGTMGDSFRLYMASETAMTKYGAYCWHCSNGGWAQGFAGAFSDTTTLSDEYLTLGAYLADDPKMTAPFIGKDIVKLIITAWLIILNILTVLGLT